MAECLALNEDGVRCSKSVHMPQDPWHMPKAVCGADGVWEWPQAWKDPDWRSPEELRAERDEQKVTSRRTAEQAARSVTFDPKTHARRSDPVTSHAAAEATNLKQAQMNALEVQYREHPEGLTRDEAEELAGLRDTWRRTSDLHTDGRIECVLGQDGQPLQRKLRSGRYGQVYRAVVVE